MHALSRGKWSAQMIWNPISGSKKTVYWSSQNKEYCTVIHPRKRTKCHAASSNSALASMDKKPWNLQATIFHHAPTQVLWSRYITKSIFPRLHGSLNSLLLQGGYFCLVRLLCTGEVLPPSTWITCLPTCLPRHNPVQPEKSSGYCFYGLFARTPTHPQSTHAIGLHEAEAQVRRAICKTREAQVLEGQFCSAHGKPGQQDGEVYASASVLFCTHWDTKQGVGE